MWISKEEMDKIEKRLKALEDRKPIDEDCINFTVYKETLHWPSYGWPPRQVVSVKDAINKILSHLGMELKYVEGVPTTVQLQKLKRT